MSNDEPPKLPMPKHTSYRKEADGSFSFQCPGNKDDPKLKDGWKIFCKLRRGHDGPHIFGDEDGDH